MLKPKAIYTTSKFVFSVIVPMFILTSYRPKVYAGLLYCQNSFQGYASLPCPSGRSVSCSYSSTTDISIVRTTYYSMVAGRCEKYIATCRYTGDVCASYGTDNWRRIYGKIWTDLDGDGSFDSNEEWADQIRDVNNYKGVYLYSCGFESLLNDNFKLMLYAKDDYGNRYWVNELSSWICSTDRKSTYYRTRADLERYAVYTFRLEGLPSGYDCDSWVFWRNANLPATLPASKNILASGNGCTADIGVGLIDSCSGTDHDCWDHNHLWWKIKPASEPEIEADSWKTVIDGDIYADSSYISPPEDSPLSTFNNSIINSSDGSTGGYLFARDFISSSIDYVVEDYLGGFASNLLHNGIPHDDKGLESLSFEAPTHDSVIDTNSIDSFEDGGVYRISVEDFNNSMESDTYYSLPSGIAIVYVEGSDDAVFEGVLQNTGLGRLLLVFNSDIYISKDVGFTDILAYTVSSIPNIDAAILTSGNVIFEYGGEGVQDIPIMVQGPLVSKGSISLTRDLGAYNENYPSISVQHDQGFMCELSELEKSETGYGNYTGLRTFDIQFDYGE